MPNNLSFNCVQPEDGQILCSDKSLFARQQAERHSNFDVNLVDVEPEGGEWGFGRQCVFKVPRFADLLGPIDLVIEIPPPVDDATYTGHSKITSAFVESLGYAMIESAELFLGNTKKERKNKARKKRYNSYGGKKKKERKRTTQGRDGRTARRTDEEKNRYFLF